MLRFILCDDDELQLDEIAGFIRQWADTNKINVEISQFTSGKAVLEQFQPQRNDIVICDAGYGRLDAGEQSALPASGFSYYFYVLLEGFCFAGLRCSSLWLSGQAVQL